MKLMKGKIIQSGKVFEVIEYENEIPFDYQGKAGIRDKEPDEEWTGKRQCDLKRAQADLRRLVWSNVTKYSKFVTLTYEKAEADIKQAQKDWKAFQQRLQREGYKAEYVRVFEWQERREAILGEKSLHIHAVLFTDRYIPADFLSKAWKMGFVKINSIKDVRNLGAYVCKYLTKDTLAKYGSHSYMCSKGLLRPHEKKMISHDDLAESLQEIKTAGTMTYTHDFIINAKDADGKDIEINRGTYSQYITKL